ncbi:methyl-accepting chemotaxis protein [Halobacillus trueperi]|uniref:Methyl-accepting chemotaxis protein n=1 Tax=Halobacillus trueperi TaxID=156205 RepID=A0A3E0JAH4_9BACI|nr:methyl-accepting chemotaxis protein [Halobacillus trueperi]REJ09911.1 methyl-accepting chemotaxis protein [Halobacillus trueperi]
MKSLKKRILVSFSVVIMLTVILSSFNFFATKYTNDRTKDMVDHQLPLLIADEKLALNLSQRIALTRAYVLFEDESYREQFNEYTRESVEVQEELLSMSNSEEAEKLVEQSIQWRKMVQNEVFNRYDTGNEEQAIQALREKVTPLGQEVMEGFENMALQREQMMEEEGQNILQAGNTMMIIGSIISLASIIIGIAFALVIANRITNPIKKVVKRMMQISEGDISQEPVHVKSKDEIGQLADATNDMQRSLNEVIQSVSFTSDRVTGQSEALTQSAYEVREGSEQIASTMQELSSGAESQANGATHLSDQMRTFGEKIQEANASGESISETSNEVLAMTDKGRELMQRAVAQMHAIDSIVKESTEKVKGLDHQSKEISKLVRVIEDIADQTNLLSLNAAIEAARAGEHGKGFAVVADEVRKLAEQVTHSVGDITEIVEGIQKETGNVVSSLETGNHEVDQGSKQMKETGATFDGINGSVSEMVAKIQTISAHLKEIAENSMQMNHSIEEIASITEESAAGVEQAAASAQQSNSSMEEVSQTAEDLSNLAEQLNEQVRRFKL